MTKLLHVLLPLNFLGISGFWVVWFVHPTEPLTLEMAMHIAAELLTGLGALYALFLLRRGSAGRRFYFALGLLFYASLQATGWAFEHRVWPLLTLMTVNCLAIALTPRLLRQSASPTQA